MFSIAIEKRRRTSTKRHVNEIGLLRHTSSERYWCMKNGLASKMAKALGLGRDHGFRTIFSVIKSNGVCSVTHKIHHFSDRLMESIIMLIFIPHNHMRRQFNSAAGDGSVCHMEKL